MKVVVINGKGGVGKDEFVKQCAGHALWCVNLSTVDFVKEIAQQCGWDGTKTAANRKFLSDLKDLLSEWGDIPFQKVKERIEYLRGKVDLYDFSSEELIVFVHCREPKEIQRYVDEFGAITLLIRRSAAESVEQINHADNGVLDYQYDYTIVNDGTIEELADKALDFMQKIGVTNLKI